MLKKIVIKLMQSDHELPKILQFIKQYISKEQTILDIGCGYGRILTPLKSEGYSVLGVEKNSTIVNSLTEQGIDCIQEKDFKSFNKPVRMIILSHIIEHFTPPELFKFLNQCLDKLDNGGYLVIATPLYSQYFYDDFDHVKPYHPAGIQMVFGGNNAQVQYYSPHRLELKSLWFRKSPLFNTLRQSKYLNTPCRRLLQGMDLCILLLYKITFKLVSRKDGWIGVFQKC